MLSSNEECPIKGGGPDRTSPRDQGEEAAMTRAEIQEKAVEGLVLSMSGILLALYIWAKIAVWPWGAWSF
jgi:hypothetical protein